MGRLRAAAPLRRQTFAVSEREASPDHPDTAGTLNTLAGIYADLGSYADTERLAERSMAILEDATCGREMAVFRVQSLATRPSIARVRGRYAEPERLSRWALASAKAILELADLNIATYLNDLAVLYSDTGRLPACGPSAASTRITPPSRPGRARPAGG